MFTTLTILFSRCHFTETSVNQSLEIELFENHFRDHLTGTRIVIIPPNFLA